MRLLSVEPRKSTHAERASLHDASASNWSAALPELHGGSRRLQGVSLRGWERSGSGHMGETHLALALGLCFGFFDAPCAFRPLSNIESAATATGTEEGKDRAARLKVKHARTQTNADASAGAVPSFGLFACVSLQLVVMPWMILGCYHRCCFHRCRCC
jgi:hypothetical protein